MQQDVNVFCKKVWLVLDCSWSFNSNTCNKNSTKPSWSFKESVCSSGLMPCQTSFVPAVQRQSASSMWSRVQDHRLDSCCLAPAELLPVPSRSTWSTYGPKAFLLLSCGSRAQPSNSQVRFLFPVWCCSVPTRYLSQM